MKRTFHLLREIGGNVAILAALPGLLFVALPLRAGQDAALPGGSPAAWVMPVSLPPHDLHPQNLHEKFADYAIAAFGPRTLFAPVVYGAGRMLDPPRAYPREWRHGAGAFGRNYGSGLAHHATLETARFLTAAVLHEDIRYRPSHSRNPLMRGVHAAAFTFVDKSDSGHNRLAISSFAGAEASGFVGNLYLPPGFNTISHAQRRATLALGGLVLKNLFNEFLPELQRAMARLKLPFQGRSIPAWWIQ